MTRILVVEDEESLSDPLTYLLGEEGFEVEVVDNGLGRDYGVRPVRGGSGPAGFELPGLSGTEVCRQLRQRSSCPVIMLTAKDSKWQR